MIGGGRGLSRMIAGAFLLQLCAGCSTLAPLGSSGAGSISPLYRRRGGADDADKALPHYRAALEKDPEFAPPHRSLGLMFLKKGDSELARSHFRQYLSLAPNTDDRQYVQQYLATLESGADP